MWHRIISSSVMLLMALLLDTQMQASPYAMARSPATAEIVDGVSSGNVITVTTSTDEINNDGDCSLREAVQAAAIDAAVDACPPGDGADTIILPAGEYLLASGQITLTGTITLQGSPTATTSLDGGSISRVLYVYPNANVVLRHLDIRNGYGEPEPGSGGGVANYGTTRIAYSAIHHNHARSESWGALDGSDGGGIFNGGVLTVTNSTISANAAGEHGCFTLHGGLSCGQNGRGGGIANTGTLTLDNATVVDNLAGISALYADENAGGGIYNEKSSTVNVKNSIIAGNQGNDCAGTITSPGNNIFQTNRYCAIRGSYLLWRAYLGPLQDNGGPTLTQAPAQNSPAIDAGDCTDSSGTVVNDDQRGMPRPDGEGCDIGAFESPDPATFAPFTSALPRVAYQPSPCTITPSTCNLTHSPMHDGSPSWSPDRRKIVFVRSQPQLEIVDVIAGIYVMNADGSNPVRLTNHGEQPIWSPDGTQIAFISAQNGNPDIYVMDADGDHQMNITNSVENAEQRFAWSPDGAKLLYLVDGGEQASPDLCVINTDGSQKRQLATDVSLSNSPWSPDSKKIVYSKYTGFLTIKVIAPDGSPLVELPTEGGLLTGPPAWSPDGSKMVVNCGFEGNKVCTMNSDGSQVVSHTGEREFSFPTVTWSPDSNRLLIMDDGRQIVIMNADGSQKRELVRVDDEGYVGEAAWSPDSRAIVFVNAVSGNREIYVLGVAE